MRPAHPLEVRDVLIGAGGLKLELPFAELHPDAAHLAVLADHEAVPSLGRYVLRGRRVNHAVALDELHGRLARHRVVDLEGENLAVHRPGVDDDALELLPSLAGHVRLAGVAEIIVLVKAGLGRVGRPGGRGASVADDVHRHIVYVLHHTRVILLTIPRLLQ